MLKYLKYDFKATWKVLVGYLVAGILASTYIQLKLMGGSSGSSLEDILLGLCVFISFLIVVSFITYSIRVFSRELNSDHAYLTFSTPKHLWKMVASKLCMIYLWSIVYALVAFYYNFFIASLLDARATTIFEVLKASFHIRFVIELLMSLVIPIAILSLVYLSMSISKMTFRNKKLHILWILILIVLAILYFQGFGFVQKEMPGEWTSFGIFYDSSEISTHSSQVTGLNIYSNPIIGTNFGGNFLLGPTIYSFIVTLLSVALTGWILDKKVNL
ncbi:MAG: hypothetical protein Q4Q17_01770 [Tissierellia bacterium]|nr:hypothetical protein [Tissierellia bacterium]